MAVTSQHPPIAAEQWLDFVIAACAHRSSNPAHQAFGKTLVDRYFMELPERYKSDPVATEYLDNMLCAVASAMRGFSVARNFLDTYKQCIQEEKTREIERAKALDAYSPFTKEGNWGKVLTLLVGIGIGGPLLLVLQNWFNTQNWLLLLGIGFVVAVMAFGVDRLVYYIRNKRLDRVEKKFPRDIMLCWRSQELTDCRAVAKQFLPLALSITRKYYPSEPCVDYAGDRLNRVIEDHFAFKADEIPEWEPSSKAA